MSKKRIASVLLLTAFAATVMADVRGILTKHDGAEVRGTVRWQPVQKQYVVTIKQGNLDVTVNVRAAEVASVRVAPPPGWENIVKEIREGRGAAAVPRLENIVKQYSMLQYDVVAGTYLARIHMSDKRPADALRICEAIIASKPDAGTTSDLAPLYWEAMMATGKTAKLEPAIEEAIRSAPREIAAHAYILRGDMLRAENRTRDALKDGYLRTILMFRDARRVQAEALFKAAQAHDALQEVQYAERMRQSLLANFPDSEFAKQLRGND